MRTPIPQPGFTEADVIAVIESDQFIYADCFTIIPLVGDRLYYTTAQRRVSVVPVTEAIRKTYEPNRVIIKGLRMRNNLGIEVDEQQAQFDYPEDLFYQEYLSWPRAFLTGRLDGATLRRDRYFAVDWGRPWVGGVQMFKGLVSTLDKVGRQSATVNVKSDLIKMDIAMPKSLWEPQCQNTWGDAGCGVVQDDWAVQGFVGASPSSSILPWDDATAHYNQGKIYIENTDNVVRIRTISRVVGTNLHLSYPLDFTPIETMQFTAYPGCPKTTDPTYGCPKYHGTPAWKDRYKGFPFVPVAETAI